MNKKHNIGLDYIRIFAMLPVIFAFCNKGK